MRNMMLTRCAFKPLASAPNLVQMCLPLWLPVWYIIGMDLQAYIEKVGKTYSTVARELGVAPQYVSRIARGVREPSGHLALKIERWSQGQVRREVLRPDLYPSEDRAERV
jgi:DNA-binding transcriptional regulator YdaS (Cro superfamily)